MSVAYEKDIVAWANEQAGFIRAGRFDLLDLENIEVFLFFQVGLFHYSLQQK